MTNGFFAWTLLAVPVLLAGDAHFHHLHLNSNDPAKAIDFYTRTFDCEKARFAGEDAVLAQKSWLLFTKVASPPPSEIISSIWHFGWGAEDMPDAYRKQIAKGTKFGTPLTELFPKFFYAYVDGPDRAIIELNTSANHNFGHLHLLSDDAVSAGEWYVKHFGATWKSGKPPSREPRFIGKIQVGPNASLMMDNVNIIIFPIEYARQAMPEWKERKTFESPKGRVVDHVGFSVENLGDALEKLRKDGVAVTEVKSKSAFIEGPDKIRIELVEQQAWGGDHVGKSLPEHVHGDECLFCHRNDIGQSWQKNTHGISLRQRDDAPDLVKKLNPPDAVEFFLGSRHEVRFLKKEGYGKFAIMKNGAWDKDHFADRCAGCHTTAVETASKTFSAFGHDCYVCHGVVDLNHTGDTKLVLLSKKRRDAPEVVTSICAQCHLRGGKSKSTGLPYPNQFVAGDNLFRDFQVNFALADDPHVYRNVRDVVVKGSETTCVSCHKIHGQSSEKHRRVLREEICLDCHNAEGPRKVVKPYTVRSAVCEY